MTENQQDRNAAYPVKLWPMAELEFRNWDRPILWFWGHDAGGAAYRKESLISTTFAYLGPTGYIHRVLRETRNLNSQLTGRMHAGFEMLDN